MNVNESLIQRLRLWPNDCIGWQEMYEAADEIERSNQSEREGWRYAGELEEERKRLTAENERLRTALAEPAKQGDFVSRLEAMQSDGHTWLTIPAVLALFSNSTQSTAAPTVPTEPVAWASPSVIPLREGKNNHPCVLTDTRCAANTVALYTKPPQRKPLKNEQIDDCLWPLGMAPYSTLVGPDEIRRFARAIEKLHGITDERD
jgi:hypothetical protein